MAEPIINPPLRPEKQEQQDSSSWLNSLGFTTVSIIHIKEGDLHNGRAQNTIDSGSHSFFLPFMGAPQTVDLLFDETPSGVKTKLSVDHQLVHNLYIKKKVHRTREKVADRNGRYSFPSVGSISLDFQKFEETYPTPYGDITYKVSTSATSPGADSKFNVDSERGRDGSHQVNLNVGSSYVSVTKEGEITTGVNVGNTYFAVTTDSIIFGIKETIGITTVQFEVDFKPKFNPPKLRIETPLQIEAPTPNWLNSLHSSTLPTTTGTVLVTFYISEVIFAKQNFNHALSDYHNSHGFEQTSTAVLELVGLTALALPLAFL